MNSREILKLWASHPQLEDIVPAVKAGKYSIHLQQLQGAAPAFAILSLFSLIQKDILLVLENEEEAERLYSDLESVGEQTKILFLTDSFKKIFNPDSLSSDKVRLRTEALDSFRSKKKPAIVVTYPSALAEKVVNKDYLDNNTYNLEVGDTPDLDTLLEILYALGYEREDFVFEPGHFSLRGSIIDIFSFNASQPFRLEWDGEVLSSIRHFDPETQLSTKVLQFIKLVPNIRQEHADMAQISFFEYLEPSETCLVLQNWKRVTEDLENKDIDLNVFISISELIASCTPYPKIEFGLHPYWEANTHRVFNQQSQPGFGKNLDLALSHLKENEVLGKQILIFSENTVQIDRLYSLIKDKGRSITFHPVYHGLSQGFLDKEIGIAFYTEHQVFNRYFRPKNKRSAINRNAALTLKELKELKPGDFVTHVDHGVGAFEGLHTIDNNGVKQEVVRIRYRDNDLLFVGIQSLHKISRFSGKDGDIPKIHKLGSGAWEKQKAITKKKVKDIARELIALYAARKAKQGFAFSPDTYLQHELEASFPYEDTPDQAKASADIKKDMESHKPMDRLLCGDVGFGKTEVAVRAAFKAVTDNKQVAILVPTTILAYQHYRTFQDRLENFPCNIDFVNRFKTKEGLKQSLLNVKSGKTDILIGTHRLLSKDITFKNLGLLIIDEEQKFGVSAKEKLKSLRVNVDTLTLTATPIPRTLHFSLMGARDLSVISTPPPNRQPIETSLHVFNLEVIVQAIDREVARGGQVFFVHNRVADLEKFSGMIRQSMPHVRVALAHGQMEGSTLEKVMLQFMEGEFDVLVSTSIIETGLDISNGNTMIIHNAHMFGLSDLHQMRGRVGRSDKKAYCLLITPPLSSLTDVAKKRLRTLEEFNELGSGFQIAMRDMDIRGAGNLLGGEQSGFISELGFDMYHKILDEAIAELKEDEFKELFADTPVSIASKECQVETDYEMLLPDAYVSQITERLALYQELSAIENATQLEAFYNSLQDRFGPVPHAAFLLIETVKLKWLGKQLGFERIVLQNNKMKIFLPSNPNSAYYSHEIFTQLLQYVSLNPTKYLLKQTEKALILQVHAISGLNEALLLLNELSSVLQKSKVTSLTHTA